jgi:hypothetical protein
MDEIDFFLTDDPDKLHEEPEIVRLFIFKDDKLHPDFGQFLRQPTRFECYYNRLMPFIL